MRTLIIHLPHSPAHTTSSYAHALVQTDTASGVPALQWSALALLPAAHRHTEVVVLLPAAAVSWHRVTLPNGLHKNASRLQAALHGLLEDQLLDEPAQLHLALQTDWKNTDSPWVAACDRTWLHSHLQALEQAGWPAHRIVPELTPPTGNTTQTTPAAVQLRGLGTAEAGWLWVQHPERGVWGLPMPRSASNAAALGLDEAEAAQADLQAEPAVVAASSAALGRPARLMAPGEQGLQALATDWDLAQFDLQVNARSRYLKSGQRLLSALWQGPNWRPARWGMLLLALSQVLGLNAWAYKMRQQWQAEQQSWTQILRESFPQTRVVVDAPVQMAREVTRLRQASGQLSPDDMETLLSAWGQALPANTATPAQLNYQNGQLRWSDFKPDAAQQAALQKALQTQGYRLSSQGPDWVLTLAPHREAKP